MSSKQLVDEDEFIRERVLLLELHLDLEFQFQAVDRGIVRVAREKGSAYVPFSKVAQRCQPPVRVD